MAKSLQYVKVLEALRAAGGPMTVEAVKALPDIVPSRLSTYLWEIKKNTTFAVRSVRDGRTVVAYELVGSGSVASASPAAPVVKPAKTPKAKTSKVAAAAAVAPIVVELVNDPIENDPVSESSPKMLASGIVDVLDEIDSDVEAFEDQSFAREYVNLL
jgi:hypothetical protein